jgi:protein ImuA
MSRFALQALAASAVPTGAADRVASARAEMKRMAFGHASVDAQLDGGLAVAALHELYAAGDADAAAVAGLALLLATRNGRDGPIVWLGEDKARREGRLYGLGLADLGVDPARLLFVEAPDSLAMLRAGAEAVACRGLAAVILAAYGKVAVLDLTATRRLALAAARSGVTTLLLRSGAAYPSAANSRWQVAAAASARLAGNAPGAPAFALTLLRHRGGIAGFSDCLEWDRERKAFGAAHPGVAPAAHFERAGEAPGRRAA